MKIDDKTLLELEFPRLLEEVVPYAFSEKTVEKIRKLQPLTLENAQPELQKVSEYAASFDHQNPIPFHEYEDIAQELRVMGIEEYQLSAASFMRIKKLSMMVGQNVVYFRKYKDYFPQLYQVSEKITLTKAIILGINAVFNRYGEVKSTASEELEAIRKEIGLARKAIQENFNRALKSLGSTEILDNIRESVIDDQRVLAVKSAFKKRVAGRTLGLSKTGSITFIQPESVLKHQFKLREKQEEEKKEISRILRKLTAEIAHYQPLLEEYQAYVFDLDFVQAKARFSHKIQGVLPQINTEKRLKLIEAYHPLLWLRNQNDHKTTFPQDLELSVKNRIIAISGPNAGGKSITLKTVGLLQLMIQCGLLIPVHEKSEVFFFDKILTDIGDNQSIENHLSTYSSRLKKMAKIIENADENTLLLIDEFGTGSDPELGGALAEAFLEFFYQKQSFAIITTHYTNIKLVVEKLPHAKNAAMLFDEKTLEPMFKLEIGQAGSSFTFEVANKNNIPEFIIEKAKEKVEHDIVNLDKTIVKLQQEKYHVEKLKSDLSDRKDSVESKRDNLHKLNEQLEQKLFNFQKLYEEEHRKLQFGGRIEQFVEDYVKGKSRKDIVKAFVKILELEKHRRQKTDKTTTQRLKVTRRKINKQLQKEHVQEKIASTNQKIEEKRKKERAVWLKVGQRVRIVGSSSVGTIDKVEKNGKVTVNYGNFKTLINSDELERI